MQAIRVLRAQSRPASPSPASSPSLTPLSDSANAYSARTHGGMGTGTGTGVGTVSGEDPNANANVQHRSTPLSRIHNLTSFAKRSVPTPPPTPPIASPAPIQSTIVQDGTYLNTLGLKLNEAATKALATSPGSGPDSFKGRKPLPAGRGRGFAALLETELDASQSNPNLRHAILRLLPRSLSVIIASLSTQLSSMTSTPGFVPSSVIVPLHPSTIHALALAQFIAELLETFRTYKLGRTSPELAVARNNLEALITRVTGPILSQVQSEMASLLEQLGNLPNEYGKPNPAVVALGQYMPSFSRALRRCTFAECSGNQNMLATFLINTVWQALVNLAHRTPPPPPSRASPLGTPTGTSANPSPSPKFSGLSGLSGLSPLLKAGGLTPPSSPPKKKRVLALPDGSPQILPHKLRRVPSATDSSRSISPAPGFDSRSQNNGGTGTGTGASAYTSGANPSPVWMLWLTSLAADARAIYELLSAKDNDLGLGGVRPVEGSLPREAVDEALERFAAFKDWLSSYSGMRLIDTVPEEVPILIALPVILTEAWSERRLNTPISTPTLTQLQLGQSEDPYTFNNNNSASSSYSGMAKLVGYESEEIYRRCVLSGFGKADEWALPVARCVLERLKASSASSASSSSSAVSTTTFSREPFVFTNVTPNASGGDWSARVIKWLEERVDGDEEMSG